ncbi:MAG: hypothetical protein NTW29_18920 [Bacteroidetes bacterium]|nr:hypothetical protein [Bacteroidota bacterium]
MKKVLISALSLLFIYTAVSAQQKLKFSSQTYAGVLLGDGRSDLQLQTINGVKWKNWFGGIGAGIDWYSFRSVPVFASVNRDIFKKGKNTLLLSADVGINLPWHQDNYYYIDFTTNNEFRPGLYWASGVGYRFGVGKADNALLMNFGYSFKQSRQEFANVYPCLNPPCLPFVEKYDYRLNRLSIKLGWIF